MTLLRIGLVVAMCVGGAVASNLGGPNYGQLVVHLKPRNQRPLGVNDIIKELRPKLSAFAGMKIYLQNPPTIRIGGQVTKSLYQFSMQTPDKPELYAQAEKLTKAVEQLPGVEDVTNDVAVTTPQVNVTIDRDKAGAMGVNRTRLKLLAFAVGAAFAGATGAFYVSKLRTATPDSSAVCLLRCGMRRRTSRSPSAGWLWSPKIPPSSRGCANCLPRARTSMSGCGIGASASRAIRKPLQNGRRACRPLIRPSSRAITACRPRSPRPRAVTTAPSASSSESCSDPTTTRPK